MREAKPLFTWKVLMFDVNSNKIVEHDVLKYRERFVKDLKKKCVNKAEFVDKLFRDFMWQYWSRCEYELLIHIENGRVLAQPLIQRTEGYCVDLTDSPDLDWPAFAELLIRNKGYKDGTAKIDVYDQLRFRFDELADFCWEYKHKYQRNKKEEINES